MQLVEPAAVYTRKVRDVLLENYPKDKAARLLAEVKLAVRDPTQLTTREVPDKFDILLLAVDANHDFYSNLLVEQVAKSKVDFLRPNHRVMPCRVQTYGCLIEWDENAASEGIDMKRAGVYRWNLVNDSCDIREQNFHVLSEEVWLNVCLCLRAIMTLLRCADIALRRELTRSGFGSAV